MNFYFESGSGQDRTVDLTIFSRALVPTELPSQYLIVNQYLIIKEESVWTLSSSDPDGT